MGYVAKSQSTVRELLFAHGDDRFALDETVRVLDSIVTDYIIEICHQAASVAIYAGRQKVKLEDFRFTFRKDETKLGRMLQLAEAEKQQRGARRAFDAHDDKIGDLAQMGDAAGDANAKGGDAATEGDGAPKKKRKVRSDKGEKLGKGKGKGKA